MKITSLDFGNKICFDELVNGDFFCVADELAYTGLNSVPVYGLYTDNDQEYIVIIRGHEGIGVVTGEIYDRVEFEVVYEDDEVRKVTTIRFSDR